MEIITAALTAAGIDWTANSDDNTVTVTSGDLRIVIGEATTETGDPSEGWDMTAYHGDEIAWQDYAASVVAVVKAITRS